MYNLIGQSLGRYHILEQLGEGGMATVYKAYDTRLEREVAIKVIRTDLFGSSVLERMLKRFEREAKALARLSHLHIIKVIDYGEHEGSPYLVMEYMPGGTLKQQLGKPMPWREAVRILLPIAEALDYAHEQNIIHRDIKTSNILLTQKGQPMLTDFGIAKMLESEETATLTGTGIGVGTPEYMAPEQWTGQSTAQSDIYSLGIVLYEMVTGRKPYTADTPAAILLKQANEALPRPGKFTTDLPQSVENILIKALAKNPKDRYRNMADFAKALEGLLDGTVAAKKTAIQKASVVPTRGKRTEINLPAIPRQAVIVVGIIALVIGLIVTFSSSLKSLSASLLPTATSINTPTLQATQTSIATATLLPSKWKPVAKEPGEIYLGDLKPRSATVGWGVFSVGVYEFNNAENNIAYGNPIIVSGIAYEHGLFAHAKSVIIYDIGAKFSSLQTMIGIIESCGTGAIFNVAGDGENLFTSKKIILASVQPVSIDISGVKELVLSVDPVGDVRCDTTVWGDPVLLP